MNDFVFELAKIGVFILSTIVTYKLIPWIKANTTSKQRVEAEYWIKLAVQFAEKIYEEKGQGKLKKEYVLEWLNNNNIKIKQEQADILIDMVVDRFNKNDWEW